MDKRIISLAPVLSAHPKVLILGSMPSRISLEKQQYYANTRNHFWNILYTLFQIAPIESYDEKIQFVRKRHLALWDYWVLLS